MEYLDLARRFVEEETQFQLGFLVTESSHQLTKTLDRTIVQSTGEGLQMLLAVDRDIERACPAWVDSEAHAALTATFSTAVEDGRTIAFSGCGSTGRLAVLLESMWRRFWTEAASAGPAAKGAASRGAGVARRVRGIITGGDRALIRSVESFEDYEEFGREQVRELRLQRGDLFVAISEGGETSSVIGSAHEALACGCTVFFVYNNPTDLLLSRIERSRRLIGDPRVTSVDLTTGPMALSGSTRMQATTAELLFVASAMDEAIGRLMGPEALARMGMTAHRSGQWCAGFGSLVSALSSEPCIGALAAMVETEQQTYETGRIIAYEADRYLLDVFADATERTPTFSLPPLKRADAAQDVANPWAVAYYPGLRGAAAWNAMVGRDPIGLAWDDDTYIRLGAAHLAGRRPTLDEQEIYAYPVGEEALDLYSGALDWIVSVSAADDPSRGGGRPEGPRPGAGIRRAALILRDCDTPESPTDSDAQTTWRLDLPLPRTAMDTYHHLAVKLVLNTVSTATMARMGRIRGNWMIQVSPTNKKLVDRSIRIIADIAGLDYAEAARRFYRAYTRHGGSVPSLVREALE